MAISQQVHLKAKWIDHIVLAGACGFGWDVVLYNKNEADKEKVDNFPWCTVTRITYDGTLMKVALVH